jgi:hypothetical protein
MKNKAGKKRRLLKKKLKLVAVNIVRFERNRHGTQLRHQLRRTCYDIVICLAVSRWFFMIYLVTMNRYIENQG